MTADAERLRRELVNELLELGAEVPETAWVVSPRLAAEPLEELRARVVLLRVALRGSSADGRVVSLDAYRRRRP